MTFQENLSFSSFILSDVFSRASGIDPDEMHAFMFGLRERLLNEKDFYVYTEFREKYRDIWIGFFEEFFKSVGLYPLYELIISIYDRLSVLKNFKENQAILMHFLELIKRAEDDYSDIDLFLD